MKTIVIYNSQTGFTERYAEWIAERTDAECVTLSEAKRMDLRGYDAIVFGSRVCAGNVDKINWFKANISSRSAKKLAVFCVGGSPVDSPDIAPFIERNFTDSERERVKVFYCPGGFNYEKMPVASKVMMKMFSNMLNAKKDKTESEEIMAKMISSSYDISDRKYIEPILQYLNS